MIVKLISIALLIGLVIQGSAQEMGDIGATGLVDLDKIAQHMRFPKEHLKVSDKTIEMRKKYGGRVLKAAEVSGIELNIFHPMAFVIAESDALLTGDVIRKADVYLEANKAKPEKQKLLRRIDMSDGSWGYVGVEGFGPGGAILSMTVTNPGKQRDVKIMVSCKSSALTPIAGSDSYHKMISGESDSTQAMTAIAAALIETAQNLMAAPEPIHSPSSKAAPIQAINRRNTLDESESPQPVQFVEQISYGVLVAMAALVGCVVFIVAKKWQR